MQRFYIFFFVIFAALTTLNGENVNKTVAYLKHFGYMTANTTFKDAIRLFQRYAGLALTGEMDNQTMAMMNTPRCGSDKPDGLRGVYHGSRWSIRNITYNITNHPSYLELDNVAEVLQKAFNEWSKVTDFTFSRVNGDALMSVGFAPPPPVDSGRVAASGAYPVFGGDINFSTNEIWSTNITYPNNNGVFNLHQIAMHEIGHTLGLLHSSYPDSIMTPFFVDDKLVHIHPSDKRKIRKLYNIGRTSTTQSKVPNQNSAEASLCTLTKMDAIIAYSENIVYVFNDDKYWMLSAWSDNILFDTSAYPKKISDTWKGVPANIDSAFVDVANATYFFKGSQCWKFSSGEDTAVSGFPKNIADEFPGIPNDIDAVMSWPNGNIYFFSGGRYWRFRPNKIPEVDASYPKPITLWDPKLTEVDAALYFMDETFFFKDMFYYKYQEVYLQNVLRQYPRHTKFWWFNC